VLPFGLTNALSAFMSIINEVIADLPFAVVYLDDILIFSKTPEEHVRHVEEVFKG
jgi:putative transposase